MRRLLAILLPAALLLGACSRSETYRTASGTTWGTLYNITYRSSTDLTDSITAVMQTVDNSLSAFNQESALWRVNHGDTLACDSMMRRVIACARRVTGLSGGCYDPTVMPLVNLWGFGPEGQVDHEPSQEQIDSALVAVGFAGCRINPDGSIHLKHPRTQLDFSSVAKGLGCDLVAEMLRRNGVTDYMVEIGGEMALSGSNPHGEPWHVQIDAPVDGPVHHRAAIAALTDCGVASSGNYRNYRDTGSGRVGHTISPLTGHPADCELLAVTVKAPDCMTADALATACMAMPLDSARAMIASLGDVEALYILPGPSAGAYKIVATPGFPLVLNDR